MFSRVYSKNLTKSANRCKHFVGKVELHFEKAALNGDDSEFDIDNTSLEES